MSQQVCLLCPTIPLSIIKAIISLYKSPFISSAHRSVRRIKVYKSWLRGKSEVKMEGLAQLAPSLGFFSRKKKVYYVTSCFLGTAMLALPGVLMGQ